MQIGQIVASSTAMISDCARLCRKDTGSEKKKHAIEEEEFYKLRPANKTDHLCQSWQ